MITRRVSTVKKLKERNVMNANGSVRYLEKRMHCAQFRENNAILKFQHNGDQRNVLGDLVGASEKRVLREHHQYGEEGYQELLILLLLEDLTI